MHIPDGFISPQTYLPAYALAAGLWGYAARRVHRQLDADTLPFVAAYTALAFVLMMVALPLPGGTTAHAAGIGLLAVCFGGWMAFLAISLVLAMQALLFGDGGITALPINALAMGLVGSFCALAAWKLLTRLHETLALFLAGWLSIVVPAALVAVVLGMQPAIAHDAQGAPLFFPFGLSITLPAVVLPHVLVGIAEGVLTVLGYRYLTRLRSRLAA
ncbi:MAG: energy-coupling factor ABC transporter permease [Betaproteobacteria bacterium]|nr:energy-coupling factor ABC transporter permease [Betaproteobacteria bacterium]